MGKRQRFSAGRRSSIKHHARVVTLTPVLEETVETVVEELDGLTEEAGDVEPDRGSEPQDRTT